MVKLIRNDGDFVEDVFIGKLTVMSPKKWFNFKKDYAAYFDLLDYAVVKEFENGDLLIEENRINFILNGGQISENML